MVTRKLTREVLVNPNEIDNFQFRRLENCLFPKSLLNYYNKSSCGGGGRTDFVVPSSQITEDMFDRLASSLHPPRPQSELP
jgi:hypothetical protein